MSYLNRNEAANEPKMSEDELILKARKSLWEMTVMSSGVVKVRREKARLCSGLSVEIFDDNKLQTATRVVGLLRSHGLIDKDTGFGVPDNLKKGSFVSIGSNLEVAQSDAGIVTLKFQKPEFMTTKEMADRLKMAEDLATGTEWVKSGGSFIQSR